MAATDSNPSPDNAETGTAQSNAPKKSGFLSRFKATSRKQVWFRRICLVLLTLIFVICAIPFTPVPRMILTPMVSKYLNMPATIETVDMGLRSLAIKDLKLHVDGVEGKAAEFLSVEDVHMTVDWWKILRGTGGIETVTLTRPIVRVSQSADDGSLNIAKIEIPQSDRPTMRLPNVAIKDAMLELGEHSSSSYRALKKLVVGGGLYPTAGNERAYIFTLGETNRTDGEPGVHLDGRIDADGLDVTLTGITIGEWTDENMPGRVRQFVDSLELSGGIKRADFSYHNNTPIGPIVELENVAMTLPVPPEEGTGENLRMTSVNGTMTFANDRIIAQVSGMLGDLPYKVDLQYMGFSDDSAFQCVLDSRDFQLQSNPDLLPYVPDLARLNLSRFSKPTAIVDASVVVTRGPPTADGPAPVQSSGWIEFDHGSAAFQGFPYRFYDLAGRVTFNDERIDIERITGVSQSGTVLNATGWFAPLNSDPGAEIHIRAEHLTIDDELRDTLGSRWRPALERVMDKVEFARLIDLGLMLRADEHHAFGEVVDGIPVFALGGVSNVDLVVSHPGGTEHTWQYTADVQFDRFGLIAGDMPLPIIGHDVNLRVTPGAAGLTNGSWTTITGTPIDLFASIIHENDSPVATTRVRVDARSIPIDDVLIDTLPRPLGTHVKRGTTPPPDEQPLLRRLGISGNVGVSAEFTSHDSTSKLHAEVAMDNCAMQPDGSQAAAERIIGTAIYDDGNITLDLNTSVCNENEESSRSSVNLHATIEPVENDAASASGQNSDMRLNAEITSDSFDVSLKVEDLIAPLASSAMESLTQWRAEHAPAGAAKMSTHVTGSTTAPKVTLQLDDIDSLGITLDSSRLEIGRTNGHIDIAIDGAARDGEQAVPYELVFSGLQGPVQIDGARIGDVYLDGNWPIRIAKRGEKPRGFTLTVNNGELNPQANTAVLTMLKKNGFISDDLIATVTKLDLAGMYRLVMRMDAVGHTSSTEAKTTRIAMRIEPLELAATINDHRFDLDSINGEITAAIDVVEHEDEPAKTKIAGWFEDLCCETEAWSAKINGPWSVREDGWLVSGDLDVVLREIDNALLALLPSDTQRMLRDADIQLNNPLTLESGQVTLAKHGESPLSISLTGKAAFDIQDAKLAERIRNAAGTAEIHIERDNTGTGTNLAVNVTLPSAVIGSMVVHDVRVQIERHADEKRTTIPVLNAALHNGRIVGSVVIRDPATEEQSPKYLASIQLSGVDLAHLVADLSRSDDEPIVVEEDPDYSGAALSGEMRVSGVLGEPETRRGRGGFRAAGGRIVSVPLVLPLIELLNLQLPSSESLDLAQATFFIEGSIISFEDIGIYSRSLVMPGFGTLNWETRELNVRVFSRGARTIPILGQIYEALRNELVSARVTGTVNDPSFSIETLRGSHNSIGTNMGARDASRTERAILKDAMSESTDTTTSNVLRPVQRGANAGG
ncbi:MAG: hypothetical protein H6815_05690 [Phycisphaeraceae bacterium]|nr:hypothetical protein [Phycisphaerales bacterium]MCB9859930.1 hypothetical protein [Phycisphaeraceae bacterium]